jgi:hypothetical protein
LNKPFKIMGIKCNIRKTGFQISLYVFSITKIPETNQNHVNERTISKEKDFLALNPNSNGFRCQ